MRRPPEGLAWSTLVLAAGALPVLAVLDAAWPGLVTVAAATVPGLLIALAVVLGVARWVAASVVWTTVVALALLVGRGGELSARDAFADGIARLFSTATPAPASGALVAPLVLIAGTVSVLVALRTGRGRVGAVAGAFALYLVAAALTGGRADRLGLVAMLLVVLVVAGWWSKRPAGAVTGAAAGEGSDRVALFARTGLGLLSLGLVGTISGLGSGVAGFEARSVVDAPRSSSVQASPLSQVAAWNADPARALLSVQGARYPLKLVALTIYDGASWRGDADYDQLGDVGAPSLPPGPDQVEVTSKVRIEGLRSAWLPTPGRVEGLKGTGAVVDPETGALLADQELAEGLDYSVTARVEVATPAALDAAGVPTGAAARRYLRTPDLPPEMAAYAEAVTRNAPTPYKRGLAIEAAIRGNREARPNAPSGNSYARLLAFLFGEPGTFGGRVGTSEQFASAFAVLARHVGLPSRVVVGFRPGTEDPARKGVSVVRGEDALAWPEVYFTDIGWVPFSPTPGAGRLGTGEVDQTPLGTGGPTPPPGPDPTAGATTPAPTPTPEPPAAAPVRESGPSAAVLAGVAVGLAVALVLGLLVTARLLRSRRHRRAGAVGAWAEIRDLALLSGAGMDPRLSARSAGEVLRERWQAPEVMAVARAAERAAFAPVLTLPPGQVAPSDDLWPEVRASRRRARATSSLRRRMLWRLDPRPLRATSGSPTSGSPTSGSPTSGSRSARTPGRRPSRRPRS